MRTTRSLAGVFASTFRLGLAAIVTMVLVTAGMYAVVVVRYESRRTVLAEGDRAVRSAQQAMVDQETGLRAYLATGDRVFLEPYDQGRRRLAVDDRAIEARVGADARLAPLLVRMNVAEQMWIREWAVPAASAHGPAADPAFLHRGKDLFDAYRAAEAELLNRFAEGRNATVRTERVLLVGGLILQFAICVLTASLGFRRYRRMRSEVVEPAQRMLGAMRHAASGRVADVLALDVDGPAELQEIGFGLVEMTAALAHERALSEARADENVAQARKLRQILELAREISGSLSLRYVVQSVVASASAVSGSESAGVWLVDDEGSELRSVGDPPRSTESTYALGDGIIGQAARDARTMVAEAGAAGATAAFPLVVGARVVGALALVGAAGDAPGDAPTADTVDVLETIAAHAASAVEAARLHGRTKELTQIDALTRLPNRRRLDADLVLEIERARRYHRPFSFVMLDVDHFKRCNDRYGHQAGDEVLQQVAGTLAAEVRASDTVYRYGGEEFAILARDTSLEGAEQLAQRLRAAVADRIFGHDRIRVTISLGVGVAPDDGLDAVELIGAADERLFAAKRAGRNRVVAVAPELIVQT